MSAFKLSGNKEVQVKPSIDMSRYDDGLCAVLNDGFDRFLSVREYFELEREICRLKTADVPFDILNPRKYQWTSDAWIIRGNKLCVYNNVKGLAWQEYTDKKTKGLRYKYYTPNFTYCKEASYDIKKLLDTGKERHELNAFVQSFVVEQTGLKINEQLGGFKSIAIDLPIMPKEFPQEDRLVPVAVKLLREYEMLIFGHLGCFGTARGIKIIGDKF